MLDETQVLSNGVNGSAHDVVMQDTESETHPTALETDASMSSVTLNGASPTSSTPAGPHHDDDKPPPAKRARMHSDADEASLAHVSPNLLCTYVRYANPNLASLASSFRSQLLHLLHPPSRRRPARQRHLHLLCRLSPLRSSNSVCLRSAH